MTPSDLRLLRQRLGLTQDRAARLCGIDPRTWRRYEQPPAAPGARQAPPPVLRLLRLLETVPGVEGVLEGCDHP